MSGVPTPDPDRVAQIAEQAADPIVIFGLDGVIEWANPAVRSLGWEPEQLVGLVGGDIIAPDDLDKALQALRAMNEGHHLPSSVPYRITTPDGSTVECDLAPWLLGDAGAPTGIACHMRPTQDSRVLRSLLVRLLAGDPSPVVLADMLGLLYHRNPAVRMLLTFLDEEGAGQVVGDDLDPLLGGVGAPAGSPWTAATATQQEVLVEDLTTLPDAIAARARDAGLQHCLIVPVLAGGDVVATVSQWTIEGGPPIKLDTYSVSLLTQLTELVLRWRRQTRELERAATRDPLTGLPNRRALDEFDANGPRRDLGVLYIDLDRFKPVNDRLGHAAGDLVLRTVANRLLTAVRPTDIVARLGGDEFGIVCPGCSRDELTDLAGRVNRLLSDPIAVQADVVTVGSSIGASLGHDSVGPLLARADRALYDAKKGGRGSVCWAD